MWEQLYFLPDIRITCCRSDLYSSSSSLLKLRREKHLLQQPQDPKQLLAGAGRANVCLRSLLATEGKLLEQGTSPCQDEGCYGSEISMEDALGLGGRWCLALSDATALQILMLSRCCRPPEPPLEKPGQHQSCPGFSKGGSGGRQHPALILQSCIWMLSSWSVLARRQGYLYCCRETWAGGFP